MIFLKKTKWIVNKKFVCYAFISAFFFCFSKRNVIGQDERNNSTSEPAKSNYFRSNTNYKRKDENNSNNDTSIGILINFEEKEITKHGLVVFNYTINNASSLLPVLSPIDNTRRHWPRCPLACVDGWIGDDYCDEECNTSECYFDGRDCEGWCAPGCHSGWENDTYCDIICYRSECNFDGGACSHLDETRKKLNENYIEKDSNNEASFDFLFPFAFPTEIPSSSSLNSSTFISTSSPQSFNYSLCQCSPEKIGNGRCNEECNTYECNLDGRDCKNDCTLDCPYIFLGDGECDRDCDIPQCHMDKGDCYDCVEGCRSWKLGNGFCDQECNNAECYYDYGDCEDVAHVKILDYDVKPDVLYVACFKDFIGDTCCNPQCYNEESDWDGGDCGPPPSANSTNLSINVTALLELEHKTECLNLTFSYLIFEENLDKIEGYTMGNSDLANKSYADLNVSDTDDQNNNQKEGFETDLDYDLVGEIQNESHLARETTTSTMTNPQHLF